MPNESCDHGNNAPDDMLEELPESQAGTGRHKCAVCAYQKGFEAGKKAAQQPPLPPDKQIYVG